MNETILMIATAIAAGIASPLIQGLKTMAQMAGWTIKDKVALWFTLGVSLVCALIALAASGAFSPPYPVGILPWIEHIGFCTGSIFTVASVVFKQLIQPKLKTAPTA